MSQTHKHAIPANIADRCLINPEQYETKYKQSINDPDTFWGEQGKILDWITPYQKVKNTSFAPGNVSIKWYEDGTLNLAANCLDRHLQENGDRTAIIWKAMTRRRVNISLIANCIAMSAVSRIHCWIWALKKAMW